jgi:paraquat-inducible protein B
MQGKANPTVIGSFVLGAIALIVAGIVLFGSGNLFKTERRFVSYFQGSVAGLSVGAPVTFRGVPVGSVKKIEVNYRAADKTFEIPVYYEITLESIHIFQGTSATQPIITDLIKRGLRAKLTAQSYVTGQLAIELDFLPDVKETLIGFDKTVPEIPSAPSDLQALKRKIEDLPFDKLIAQAISTLSDMDKLVSSPDIAETLAALRSGISSAKDTLTTVDAKVGPLTDSLQGTAESATAALNQIRESVETIQSALQVSLNSADALTRTTTDQIKPLANQIEAATRQADEAFQKLGTTLNSANAILASDSSTQQNLQRALADVAAAARSVRLLADELARNPNALITGKH